MEEAAISTSEAAMTHAHVTNDVLAVTMARHQHG